MKRIKEIFQDVNGNLSSKRVVGVLGTLTLLGLICWTVWRSVHKDEWSTAASVLNFSLISFLGLLGVGSAVENIRKK